jgi:hypothetical protein
MVEPTESESKAELDRFVEAMIAIRDEIRAIEEGRADRADNPLKHAPHTAAAAAADSWQHAYRREEAAYPLASLRAAKYWPPVARVDNVYGDRHLSAAAFQWRIRGRRNRGLPLTMRIAVLGAGGQRHAAWYLAEDGHESYRRPARRPGARDVVCQRGRSRRARTWAIPAPLQIAKWLGRGRAAAVPSARRLAAVGFQAAFLRSAVADQAQHDPVPAPRDTA